MNKEIFFDAFRGIDPKYIASAAPRERGGARRGARIRTLAIAAAVALLTVCMAAVLPMLSAQDNVEYEYRYLDDLPTVEGYGAASYSMYMAPKPNNYTRMELTEDDLNSFFKNSNIPFISEPDSELIRYYGEVLYDESGKAHSVLVDWLFADGGNIHFTVQKENILYVLDDGHFETTLVNGYQVGKYVNYARIVGGSLDEPGSGTPVKESGTTSVQIYGTELTLWVLADNRRIEEAEIIYNFVINAEFDFKALKK